MRGYPRKELLNVKQNTFEGKAKTKNGIMRVAFSAICIILEVLFIAGLLTELNRYSTIIDIATRLLATVLVLVLYASDRTSYIIYEDAVDNPHPHFPRHGCGHVPFHRSQRRYAQDA